MKKPVILAVDDQSFILETISTMLKDKYEVHTFTSGKDAVKYMVSHKADLVLLDYEMPQMTGYETLLAIRSNKLNRDAPVIFLTAETNDRMKMEMLERGASDYICKPINVTTLNQCIAQYIQK